jgi:hypothetical protein
MVGIQLQPSLSLAQRDSAARGTASAFSLKPRLEARVMICLRSYFLSAMELCAIVQGCYRCQIALAHIDADNARVTLWHGVRRFDRQTDQQVEALFAAIIPEFGAAQARSTLE